MTQVELMADYRRDLSRIDRTMSAARIGANMTSLIFAVSSAESLANRIEADAETATLSLWERKELESEATKLEAAAALLRNAAHQGLVKLQAAE